MVYGFLAALCKRSPWLRRRLNRVWYQYISSLDLGDEVMFLNYGYSDGDGRGALPLAPEDEPNRYSIQLYHRVAGAVELARREVLEVGSGRGGGSSYVKRYLSPRVMVGVDLSDHAVGFCRRAHRISGLSFVQGDAEELPFEDGSFDAVVNVESSHCYQSMSAFLGEVRRVLRPGGHFLFADHRERPEVDGLREQLLAAGLGIEAEESVTDGVVRALELDHGRKEAIIRKRSPRLLRGIAGSFSGLRGSPAFSAFSQGTSEYLRFHCTARG